MRLAKAPASYDVNDQAQLRGEIEREDKKNAKIGSMTVLLRFAKAALPAQAEGAMIYVTDDVGGAVPAFSDGTNWRRVTDRAVIA